MGEADLKFRHWALELEGPLAADAIDGDFVPIGMLVGSQGIMIRRYTVLPDASAGPYEWVNVDLLREGMRERLRTTLVAELMICWDGWELHCLLALIALTGTDYSRGFPLVRPRKIWEIRSALLPILTCECLRFEAGRPFLDPPATAKLLYGAVYSSVFSSHVTGARELRGVAQRIALSKLSQRTKAALPTHERAACTAKNASFVLAYWLGLEPDSMAPCYGFREREGVVEWDE